MVQTGQYSLRKVSQSMIEAAQTDAGIIVIGGVSDIRLVSTTKGAEGLNVIDGEHILLRDSIDTMVKGICQLLLKPKLRTTLTDATYKFSESRLFLTDYWRTIESVIHELF